MSKTQTYLQTQKANTWTIYEPSVFEGIVCHFGQYAYGS